MEKVQRGSFRAIRGFYRLNESKGTGIIVLNEESRKPPFL